MLRPLIWASGIFLGIAFTLQGEPASAFIKRTVKLKDAVTQTPIIFTATVESAEAKNPSVILVVDKDLKGKTSYRKFTIDLSGDNDAKAHGHTPELVKHLSLKTQVVVFQSAKGFVQERGPLHLFIFFDGMWFQVLGENPKNVKWKFRHIEPYMTQTFKGTTQELEQLIEDGLAGKGEYPEPDTKAKPSFGTARKKK